MLVRVNLIRLCVVHMPDVPCLMFAQSSSKVPYHLSQITQEALIESMEEVNSNSNDCRPQSGGGSDIDGSVHDSKRDVGWPRWPPRPRRRPPRTRSPDQVASEFGVGGGLGVVVVATVAVDGAGVIVVVELLQLPRPPPLLPPPPLW